MLDTCPICGTLVRSADFALGIFCPVDFRSPLVTTCRDHTDIPAENVLLHPSDAGFVVEGRDRHVSSISSLNQYVFGSSVSGLAVGAGHGTGCHAVTNIDISASDDAG